MAVTSPSTYYPTRDEHFNTNAKVLDTDTTAGSGLELVAHNQQFIFKNQANQYMVVFPTPLTITTSSGFDTLASFLFPVLVGSKRFKVTFGYEVSNSNTYEFRINNVQASTTATFTHSSGATSDITVSTEATSSGDYTGTSNSVEMQIQVNTNGTGTADIYWVCLVDTGYDTSMPVGTKSISASVEEWTTIDSTHLDDAEPCSVFHLQKMAKNLLHFQKDDRLLICSQAFEPGLQAFTDSSASTVIDDGDQPANDRTVMTIPVFPRLNSGELKYRIWFKDSSYSSGNVASVYLVSSKEEKTHTSTKATLDKKIGTIDIADSFDTIQVRCGKPGADLSTLGGGRGRMEIEALTIWEHIE